MQTDNHPSQFEQTPTSTKLEQDLAKFFRQTPLFSKIPAAEAADALVEFLSGTSLLIINNRIHSVQETDHRGDNGAQSVEWAVYTEPGDNE